MIVVRVLECSDVFHDSDCTLTLIGQVEEITEAFMAHAAQRHGAAEPADVNSKLKNVVYVSPEVAYIGDSYEHEPGTGTIHVTGGGIVVQRFASSDPTLHGADAAGGALIECKCGSTAGGTCDTFIFGGTATCSNGTCTRCGWATTIPGGGLAPPKKLLAQ